MNPSELASSEGDPSVQLLHTALFGEQADSQRLAVRRLRGVPISEQGRGILLAAVSSTDLFVRRRAALILAHWPDDVTPALLSLLDDPAWSVREAAAGGLASCLRDGESEFPEAFSRVHEAILGRSIRDGNRLVRDAAIRALTQYQDTAGTIQWLLDEFPDAKPVVRCRILTVLERFEESADLFRAAVVASLDDSDRRVRRAAAQMLTRIVGNPTLVLPPLTRRQFDRHVPVNLAARRAAEQHRRLLSVRLQKTLRHLESDDRPHLILNRVLLEAATQAAVGDEFTALCQRRIAWWRGKRRDLDVSLAGDESGYELANRLVSAVGNQAAQNAESAWLLARLVELLVVNEQAP